MDEVSLKFSDEALTEIARLAMERQTGARGLRSILVSIVCIDYLGLNQTTFSHEKRFFSNRKNFCWMPCSKCPVPMSKQCSSQRTVSKAWHRPNTSNTRRARRTAAPNRLPHKRLPLKKKKQLKFESNNKNKTTNEKCEQFTLVNADSRYIYTWRTIICRQLHITRLCNFKWIVNFISIFKCFVLWTTNWMNGSCNQAFRMT